MTSVLIEEFSQLATIPAKNLVQQRREKFYAMGVWTDK
jgi:acetyl-CoA carboxylase alpha subunit